MQLIPDPISGYNDEQYLDANPDVAAAVADGKFATGWTHLLHYGYRESRPGVPHKVIHAVRTHWLELEINADFSIPPAELRARVHGNADIADFVMTGKRIVDDLHSQMDIEGIVVDAASNILDFGCGCGRVLRPFRDLHSKANLQGTDIDPDAIDWSSNHLSNLGFFSVNGHLPDASFVSNRFDLIYSISVFTHLPEDMQFAWLSELKRITRPGGILLLTVHGIDLASGIADRGDSESSGDFSYIIGEGTKGLPTFYQNSFHSDIYIRENWTRYFDIRRIARRSIAQHQDLVVCRKRQS